MALKNDSLVGRDTSQGNHTKIQRAGVKPRFTRNNNYYTSISSSIACIKHSLTDFDSLVAIYSCLIPSLSLNDFDETS